MLTIVGVSPGAFDQMTGAARKAWEKATTRMVAPEIRSTVEDLGFSFEVGSVDEVVAGIRAFGEHEWVWLVPDSPALNPMVGQLLHRLGPQHWAEVRLISGVSRAVMQLDQKGHVLSEGDHLAVIREDGSLKWTFVEDHWLGPEDGVNWQEAKPLFGRYVVLLKRGESGQRAIEWLHDRGARADIFPVSRLTDPPSLEPVDRIIHRAERYDWVIFTSGEAVSRWFARMRQLNVDIRGLRAKVAVVGPETAARVRNFSIIPELMPESEYSQEGLVEAFRWYPVRGSQVLFPVGKLHRSFLGDELRARGALVEEPLLYENQPAPLSLKLLKAIRSQQIDALLFTASSQVDYLVDQLSVEDRAHLSHIPVFSIGPLTTRTLRHRGIEPVFEADQPSLRLLAEGVLRYYQDT